MEHNTYNLKKLAFLLNRGFLNIENHKFVFLLFSPAKYNDYLKYYEAELYQETIPMMHTSTSMGSFTSSINTHAALQRS